MKKGKLVQLARRAYYPYRLKKYWGKKILSKEILAKDMQYFELAPKSIKKEEEKKDADK